MARTVLEVVVAGDSRSLERAMARGNKATEKFGKDAEKNIGRAQVSVAKFGTAATALGGVLAGGAVATGFKTVVSAATDVSESLSKNRVLFGRYARDVDAFSRESAKSFGTSRRAALEYTGVFGNLFRSLGQSRKQSAEFSVALTKLAADMASFNNTSIEEALEAIRSGLVGETEPLRKFGVNMNDATLRQEALRQGLIKTTKEALDPQTKALAAQALIFRQTKNAQGDFARTSDGLANQQRILKAQLEDQAAALGAKLVPAALSATTALTGLIGVVQQIPQSTTAMLALGAAVGGLAGRFAGLGIAAVVSQMTAVTASTRAAGGAMAALSLAVKANPIGLLATAVGAVVGGLLAFAGANRDAKVSADDLTGAIDRQVDAVRRLKDLDIEAAQRKANVKTANAQLAAAERELAAARAAGDPSRVKSAEAALAQAKVSVTRANRDLKRSEEDANKVKRDAKTATDEAAKSARGRISTLTSERSKTRELKDTIRDQIRAAKEAGASRQQLAPLQKEHARLSSVEEKQTREVNKALRSLPKEVRSRVIVKFSLDGVSGFLNDVGDAGKRSLDGKGDGIGDSFHGAVSSVVGRAQSRFKASVPKVPSVGNGSGLNAFNGIANRFGVTVGSGLRPGAVTSSGNKSFHAMGMARDFPGPPAAMMRFFRFMKARYGPRLAELIYTPGGTGIKNGRPFTYTGKVAADHFDHVHVAMRPGGAQPMGDGLGEFVSTAYGPPWNAMNGTGTTATGVDLRPAKKAYGIAVDPRRVPLGSSVYAWPNPFGYRGKFKAFDTGGAIKGNRIDFYDWRGRSSQMSWGKRAVTLSTSPIGGGKASRSSDPNKAASDRARKQAAKIMQSQRPLKVSGAVGSNIGVNPTVSTALGVPFEGQPSFSAGAPSEAPPVPDKYLPGNAALALAGLTEDKADDLAALKGLQGMVSGDLAAAQARGDFAAIIELAGTLKGLNDQIASLNANVEQNTQALFDLEVQRRRDAEDRARLASSQYGVLANALADVVNGNLGGRIGLGYQTPGFAGAGGGVRY